MLWSSMPCSQLIAPGPALACSPGRVGQVLGRVEGIANRGVHRPGPRRAEEPQLVALDRAADAQVEVVDAVDAARRAEPARAQIVIEVVGQPRTLRVACEERPVELVAAVLGDNRHPDAAGRDVGAGAAGLIAHFLDHGLVEVLLHGPVAIEPVHHQTVHRHDVVRRGEAAGGHVGLLHAARTADVGHVQGDAAHQLRIGLDVAAGRHLVQHLAGEHFDFRVAGDVHDRRGAGDRDRFLEGPDFQVGVEGAGEVGPQFHGLEPRRLES